MLDAFGRLPGGRRTLQKRFERHADGGRRTPAEPS
jgi:hypothetical protein